MHRPVLVTAPAEAPVTPAEAKAWLRVDHDDEDELITSLVAAAVAHLDGYSGILGRAMVNQTWRQDFGCWPGDRVLRLPFPDVSSVTVKYRDEDDVEQTVNATLYELLEDARGAYVRLKDSFTAPALADDRSEPVQVTLVAGYGADADAVPGALKQAIKQLVAYWYENREAVSPGAMTELPLGVSALVAPYRRRA